MIFSNLILKAFRFHNERLDGNTFFPNFRRHSGFKKWRLLKTGCINYKNCLFDYRLHSTSIWMVQFRTHTCWKSLCAGRAGGMHFYHVRASFSIETFLNVLKKKTKKKLMSQVHEWFETFAKTVSSLNAAKDYLHGVLVSVGFNWRIRECIFGQWYMENIDHPHSNQTAMAPAGAQSRWYIYTRFLLLVYTPQSSWINMRITRFWGQLHQIGVYHTPGVKWSPTVGVAIRQLHQAGCKFATAQTWS